MSENNNFPVQAAAKLQTVRYLQTAICTAKPFLKKVMHGEEK
jgi:hypothetical protein